MTITRSKLARFRWMILTVVFDRFPTRWLRKRSGVPERFPVCRAWFFDEFRLFEVWLIDSKRFPPWRQQTGTGFLKRFPGVEFG